MTYRDYAITAILRTAQQKALAEFGATQHDIIYCALKMYGLDPALLEWHACPDGVSRCVQCGHTHRERHATGCAWVG